jgi:hypothetical protein
VIFTGDFFTKPVFSSDIPVKKTNREKFGILRKTVLVANGPEKLNIKKSLLYGRLFLAMGNRQWAIKE